MVKVTYQGEMSTAIKIVLPVGIVFHNHILFKMGTLLRIIEHYFSQSLMKQNVYARVNLVFESAHSSI